MTTKSLRGPNKDAAVLPARCHDMRVVKGKLHVCHLLRVANVLGALGLHAAIVGKWSTLRASWPNPLRLAREVKQLDEAKVIARNDACS